MALQSVVKRPALIAVALLLAGIELARVGAPAARAQPDLRSTFPGRRVGGGTRGECNSRLIVHLVPPSSVFAPGTSVQLALLEAPAINPQPLELRFRPLAGGPPTAERLLPAGGPGLRLLAGPAMTKPTLWESSYRCDESIGDGTSVDPLQFVESTSPPALSLLLLDSTPVDITLQAHVRQLRTHCGSNVSRGQLAKDFGLADLLDGSWPDQLPVRCH